MGPVAHVDLGGRMREPEREREIPLWGCALVWGASSIKTGNTAWSSQAAFRVGWGVKSLNLMKIYSLSHISKETFSQMETRFCTMVLQDITMGCRETWVKGTQDLSLSFLTTACESTIISK